MHPFAILVRHEAGTPLKATCSGWFARLSRGSMLCLESTFGFRNEAGLRTVGIQPSRFLEFNESHAHETGKNLAEAAGIRAALAHPASPSG
jgi:hypothetical protein